MTDILSIFDNARREGRTVLDERSGKQILAAFGVDTPRGTVVSGRNDAATACAGLSAPFAVKAVSRDVVHKSDMGAVRLALADVAAVETAIEGIEGALASQGAQIDGYLIEEMAPAGRELVIGGIVDPQFGPMIMVGLGGVFVEIFNDVAFRVCPIDAQDAAAMLDELRAAPILEGARGEAPIDRARVIEALCAIGGAEGLLCRHGDEIRELDINPLIVSGDAAVAVDARVVLAEHPSLLSDGAALKSDAEVRETFAPLFTPRTIAIVGASATKPNRANVFIDQLREFGFDGAIYPIHPTATEISGLPAFPSLGDTPEAVDYAYIAIPAARVPDAVAAAKGRVRFAHILAAGFAETDSQGADLQNALCDAARREGVRLLGPNCNGGYSPRGGLTFTHGAARETGSVGVFTQSGGLGIDIVRRGQERGLRFSGLMTGGNCADLGPADLLEFYLADPETKVIGMYLEGVRDGRRFYDLLRRAKAKKPVVLLKGGRTDLGHKAAVSHTGVLAADARIWQALARQTGAVLVEDLESFIDALLTFQSLQPRTSAPTRRVALFGNGGGTSVLAVDAFAEHGIEVAPFGDATRTALAAMNMPPGTSIANPIDAPIGTLKQGEGALCGQVMQTVQDSEDLDAFVLHFNLPVMWSHIDGGDNTIVENMLDAANRVREKFCDQTHFLLVLRSDGRADIDQRKRHCRDLALARGFPVYDELTNAAHALAVLRHHEEFLHKHS
ncbi:MAG: CoA-binding protein [Alphaproteobacteria bacterium]|nr:CoA-binding protein [Alphaproteobacteria bacterium]